VNFHIYFVVFIESADIFCLGDVNGDGISDLLIGAQRASNFNEGSATVIYGRANFAMQFSVKDLSVSQGVTIIGPAWSYFGYSVSSAGNLTHLIHKMSH
jgi:hypothetical protein